MLPSRSNSDAKRREERGRRMIRLKNVCVAVGGENPNLGRGETKETGNLITY